MRLYLDDHLGYKTIARPIGIPIDTVKSWIRRYRNKNGLLLGNHSGRLAKEYAQEKTDKDYEERIRVT